MEQTKKCPYCGEEILAVAKKCKHCGEWLGEKSVEQTAPTKKTDDKMLYCRQCKTLLSIDASQCLKCGNGDPFLFNQIKKENKQFTFPIFYMIIAVAAAELLFDIMDVTHGVIPWGPIHCIVVLGASVFLYFFTRAIGKQLRGNHEKEMADVFKAVGDACAIERWRTKADQICKFE